MNGLDFCKKKIQKPFLGRFLLGLLGPSHRDFSFKNRALSLFYFMAIYLHAKNQKNRTTNSEILRCEGADVQTDKQTDFLPMLLFISMHQMLQNTGKNSMKFEN